MYLNNKLNDIMNYILKNKKHVAILLGLIVLFTLIGVYVYKKNILSKVTPSYVNNKEFVVSDVEGNKNVDLYYFYTNWCPHCKNASPVWNEFKKEIGDKYNDVNINYIEVDCDKDVDIAEKYNVTSYPTIKLEYNNKIVDYDAKPNKDTLKEFLATSL